MTAPDDSGRFRPRPHDHLVEPVFSGLGLEADEENDPGEPPRRGRLGGCLLPAALVLGLIRLALEL